MYTVFHFSQTILFSVPPAGLPLLVFAERKSGALILLFMLVAIFSSPVFHHIPKPFTSQSRRWEKSHITVSVGGYLGEWHVHSWKNDPTSNASMNQRGSITNTTHSKAIKQVQGGVQCVHVRHGRSESKVAKRALNKGKFSQTLTGRDLSSRFYEWTWALS